jgi:hypothetical protein
MASIMAIILKAEQKLLTGQKGDMFMYCYVLPAREKSAYFWVSPPALHTIGLSPLIALRILFSKGISLILLETLSM